MFSCDFDHDEVYKMTFWGELLAENFRMREAFKILVVAKHGSLVMVRARRYVSCGSTCVTVCRLGKGPPAAVRCKMIRRTRVVRLAAYHIWVTEVGR